MSIWALIAAFVAPVMPAIAASTSPPASAIPERKPSPALISWRPGEVRCDSGLVGKGEIRRPWNSLSYGDIVPPPKTFRFSIDVAGRPLSIVRNDTRFILSDDVGPAFATSHFPEKSAQSNCSITYTATVHPLIEADVEDIISYSITPIGPRLPREGWDRIGAGATCWKQPFPQPLLRALPDFRRIEGTPGVKDWSLISYDTDKDGTPRNIHVAHSTGNAALTRAAEKAIADSRFTEGSRTGCLYPYWKGPPTLAAPSAPDQNVFRPEDANCPAQTRWKRPLVTPFPETWRRRSIEGWAILTYDVAPWGGIGNIKVVATQPADDFGKQAQMILQGASAEPSPTGATGCVETVRFVMSRDDATDIGTEKPLY